MKTLIIFLLPFFSIQYIKAQNIDVAFSKAKLYNDYSSEIDFGKNSKVLVTEFNQWKTINEGNKFISNVVEITESENWIYGSTRSVVTKFKFIKKGNYASYVRFMNDLAEAERQRRIKDQIAGAILLAGAIKVGGIVIKRGKELLNDIGTSYTPNNSSSSNTASTNNGSESNSSSTTASTYTPKVSFLITRRNVCISQEKVLGSYEFKIYENGRLIRTSTISQDKEGNWSTDCPGHVLSSRTFLLKNGSFRDAAKSYYEKYLNKKATTYTVEE